MVAWASSRCQQRAERAKEQVEPLPGWQGALSLGEDWAPGKARAFLTAITPNSSRSAGTFVHFVSQHLTPSPGHRRHSVLVE